MLCCSVRKSSRASKNQGDNSQSFSGGGLDDATQDGQAQQYAQDGQGVQYSQPTGQYTELIWQGYDGTYHVQGAEPYHTQNTPNSYSDGYGVGVGNFDGQGAAQTTAMPVGTAFYSSSSPSPPPASHTSTSPVMTARQSLASNRSAAPLLQQQQQPYASGGQFYVARNTYSSTYRGYGEPQESR